MRILVVSPIDREALGELRRQHDVVVALDAGEHALDQIVRDREAIVFRSGVNLSQDILSSAPDLRLLIRAGSGFDNVDLDHLRRQGIEFIRIPEPGAKAVAEMAFALMLALARNLLVADRLLRQGHWAKHQLTGYGLQGKVLGIVGAGNIGIRVGQLGAAWGMEVLGCVERPSPAIAARLSEHGIRLTGLDEVLAASDFVSVHVPLQPSTRHLLDAARLARMKPGAFLVNLSRGGVVDEEALRRELTTEGRLRGAALDVHAREGEGQVSILADLPNVILTPHVGASTIDAQREIGQRIVKIVSEHAARMAVPAAVPAMQPV